MALTIREVCHHTRLCQATIYNLISSGRLRSHKIAGRRLVLRRDLEALFGEPAAGQRADLRPPRAANEA